MPIVGVYPKVQVYSLASLPGYQAGVQSQTYNPENMVWRVYNIIDTELWSSYPSLNYKFTLLFYWFTFQ